MHGYTVFAWGTLSTDLETLAVRTRTKTPSFPSISTRINREKERERERERGKEKKMKGERGRRGVGERCFNHRISN